MAIKHLGNNTDRSEPINGDVKERELVINTVEPALYTSSDGIDVIKVARPEQGGVAYNASLVYDKGDIVTAASGSLPIQTFISLTNNNVGNALPGSGVNADWQELDTEFYNVGLHNPSATEYPNLTGQEIGATWYISGLGVDANGDSIEYTYTGGNLTGVKVSDGDRISWVDGLNTSAIWFHTPYPRINGERAGMLWRSGENYITGDLATKSDVTYVARQNSSNKDPVSEPLYWKIVNPVERGGVLWRNSENYIVGDVVSRNNVVYVALQNNNNSSPDTNPSDWKIVNPVERGGVLWRNNEDYFEGDIATWDPNNTTYVALQNSNNLDPEVNPNHWKKVGGAGSWKPGPYEEGDIVSCCGDIWVAPTGGIPAGNPSPPAAPWVRTTPNERGGIMWTNPTTTSYGKPAFTYLKGDLVTYGSDVFRCTSNVSSTSNPSLDTGHWVNVISSTSLGMTPIGGIIMYDGAFVNIPSNWHLCDGTGGTPDLSDRFIRGTKVQGDIGNTGGTNTATMPSHTHTANHNHGSVTTDWLGGHSHTANHNHTASSGTTGSHSHGLEVDIRTKTPGRDKNVPIPYQIDASNPQLVTQTGSIHNAGDHTHSVIVNTNNFSTSAVGNHSHTVDLPNLNVTTSWATGTGGTEGNLPRYYTLAYIKRIS